MNYIYNIILTLFGLVILIVMSYILFEGLQRYDYIYPNKGFFSYIKFLITKDLNFFTNSMKIINKATTTEVAKDVYDINTKKTEPHSIDTTSQRPDVLFFVLHPTLNHHTRIQHQSP